MAPAKKNKHHNYKEEGNEELTPSSYCLQGSHRYSKNALRMQDH